MAAATPARIDYGSYEEREAPSRPYRLGTKRRAPRRAERSGAPLRGDGSTLGASRASVASARPATGRHSLDIDKQLATTDANMTVSQWMQSLKTPYDTYQEKLRLRRVLLDTMHQLWQKHAQVARKLDGDDREQELKISGKLEKEYFRLYNCQCEWIGYRADCCQGRTRPIAVPIGCNHRLCPLCAWHRAENARKRVGKMFDRMTHPAMITLTIPNLTTIRKHNFTLFRQKVRQFIKLHSDWILGGVYSLETTYNRQEHTWHIHVHILADMASPLPSKADKIEAFGKRMYLFTLRKWQLEWDWLRLWGKAWGKKARKDCNAKRQQMEALNFSGWVGLAQACRTREFIKGRWQKMNLPEVEMARREAWNRENRRVIDLKPVTDRERAAFEVLKYITKVSAFSDLPEAVEPFMAAVRGARLIQTFGTWYGVKLDGDANEQDWSEMHCDCGANDWHRMGVFYRQDVTMDPDGRWRLKGPFDWMSTGSVVGPMITSLARGEPVPFAGDVIANQLEEKALYGNPEYR